jgi:hypothetical protein
MQYLKNWRSNPPFLFPSVSEKDLVMFPNAGQYLIVWFFNTISIEASKESLKSSEVKINTRASCFIELL